MSKLMCAALITACLCSLAGCGGNKPPKYPPISSNDNGEWSYEEEPANQEFDYYPLYY